MHLWKNTEQKNAVLLHFSSVKSRFKKQTKFSQSEVGYMDPCKNMQNPRKRKIKNKLARKIDKNKKKWIKKKKTN